MYGIFGPLSVHQEWGQMLYYDAANTGDRFCGRLSDGASPPTQNVRSPTSILIPWQTCSIVAGYSAPCQITDIADADTPLTRSNTLWQGFFGSAAERDHLRNDKIDAHVRCHRTENGISGLFQTL